MSLISLELKPLVDVVALGDVEGLLAGWLFDGLDDQLLVVSCSLLTDQVFVFPASSKDHVISVHISSQVSNQVSARVPVLKSPLRSTTSPVVTAQVPISFQIMR